MLAPIASVRHRHHRIREWDAAVREREAAVREREAAVREREAAVAARKRVDVRAAAQQAELGLRGARAPAGAAVVHVELQIRARVSAAALAHHAHDPTAQSHALRKPAPDALAGLPDGGVAADVAAAAIVGIGAGIDTLIAAAQILTGHPVAEIGHAVSARADLPGHAGMPAGAAVGGIGLQVLAAGGAAAGLARVAHGRAAARALRVGAGVGAAARTLRAAAAAMGEIARGVDASPAAAHLGSVAAHGATVADATLWQMGIVFIAVGIVATGGYENRECASESTRRKHETLPIPRAEPT